MRDMAIIVPTRGRPANIVKVLAAWDFTQAWDQADLVIAVDADDPEIHGYHDLLNANRPGLHLVSWPEWLPMVHKLNATALSLAGTYRALGFAGDDHLPRTIGWAARYLAALAELGSGMVYGDDGYQGAKLSTEWAVTSDIVMALGRMVPADVEHMYSDVSLLELLTAVGCARYLPEVRIEHMHPIVNKADTDEQYKRVNSREQFRTDRLAYQRWQSTEKNDQIEMVRALRPGWPAVTPNGRRNADSISNHHGRRKVRTVKRSGPTSHRRQQNDSGRLPIPRFFRRVRGATPDEIGITLADFASGVPADQAIVELGVFQGRTALLMAWGAREGNGAHVWGIDAWDLEANTYGAPFKTGDSREWAKWNVQALGYADKITLIHGYSLEQAQTWDGPLIGLLFVDADHSYDGARNDITAWAKHLAPGALIAVDDYGHPDYPEVAKAVDDLVAENFLASVQVYHDRLAVTRLTDEQDGSQGRTLPNREDGTIGDGPAAITSEGVRPGPRQAQDTPDPDKPAQPVSGVEVPRFEPVAAGKAETVSLPEPGEVPAALFESAAEIGEQERFEPVDHSAVTPDEAKQVTEDGWRVGLTIDDLTMVQLRALAKLRGVTLGYRKNKREETVQALRDGR